MLIKVWQKILANLEDRRAGTVLTAIDYAKAFNRLSFQHCLEAFAKQGASTLILRLIATFLRGRSMSVRVASTWSEPREVTGGCPQGSILGVMLFNITTDDLEEDSDYVLSSFRPEVNPPDDDSSESATDTPEDKDDNGFDDPPSGRPRMGWGPDSDDDDFPDMGMTDYLASTPNRPADCPVLDFPVSPVHDPRDVHLDDSDIDPERRVGRIIYSSEPPEPTATCLGRWEPKLVEVNKYVDDNLQEEPVNFENVQDILRVKESHRMRSITS